MTSNPKLIILNGPLGIGKSTLAKKYADDHPLTLSLDIDELRTLLSHWREKKDDSAVLSKDMAIECARICLENGNDVVVPQIMREQDYLLRLEELAESENASFHEILLFAAKEESIERFKQRAVDGGHPTGFREGGLIAMGGREVKLAKMYDEMMSLAETRSNLVRVESIDGDIENTYKNVLANLT